MFPTSLPHHGATDSGPEPDLDFSSNAHPLGPCPAVREALRRHDPGRYPDPSFSALRRRIAAVHDVDPERIVVGSGAAELIHRIARAGGGSVASQSPGFGEYAHAASCAGRPHASFPSNEAPPPGSGAVFLCLPNNPDGFCPTGPDLARVAATCADAGTDLVLDLAYLPFLESPPILPSTAIHLHAPNKAMGLVGVRAGYAVMPDAASGARLSSLAPSWVLGTEAVAFLEACVSREALSWLGETTPRAREQRGALAAELRHRGFEVVESPATHLVARPPATLGIPDLAKALRASGVRVRDTTSMGLPGWIRLGARPEPEIDRFATILDRVRAFGRTGERGPSTAPREDPFRG